MAVLQHKLPQKTVNTIADMKNIAKRPTGLIVEVLDAIADPNAGPGAATYKWSNSQSRFILIHKDSLKTAKIETEENQISNGQVTLDNLPQGDLFDLHVIEYTQSNEPVIIAVLKYEDLVLNNFTLSGPDLEDYNGYYLRCTYLYGTVVQQVTSYIETTVGTDGDFDNTLE